MRNEAKKIDMDVIDEIIKMAEGAMAKGVGKKKPDISVMEVSMAKKPSEDGDYEQSQEDISADKEGADKYNMSESDYEKSQEDIGEDIKGEEGSEDYGSMDETELDDLLNEYSKLKGK